MNEQQPYEKHLGDKLQKLTQPGDANRHWPQMKSLLDRELPEGGGSNGRPGRWWMYGIIAGILLTGAWFGTAFFSNKKKDQVLTNTTATVNNTKETTASSAVSLPSSPGDKTGSNAPDNNETEINKKSTGKANLPGAENDNLSKQNKNSTSLTKERITEEKPGDHTTTINKENNIDEKNNTPAVTTSIIPEKRITGGEATKESNNKLDKVNANISEIGSGNSNAIEKNKSSIRNKQHYASGETIRGRRTMNNTTGKESKHNSIRQVVYNPASSNISQSNNKIKNSITENYSTEGNTEVNIRATAVQQNFRNTGTGKMGPSLIFTDTLLNDYSAGVQAVPVATKVRSRFKTNSDRVKALKNRVVGTGDNKNFAIGLSLPLAFPLSDQKVVAYNFNGGANTSLDYLPMPHVQFHINQKSYVQAEVQIVSPQYIQPVLLYQSKYEASGNTTGYRFITNSVYARKLYYFSLPVGVHYSPFKNFYLGSGIQFSSLLSGIAMYDKRGYNSLGPVSGDTLITQSFSKFKNDTISGRLNGNEFRLMMDANYYWHRFTVGLRYNQALSNYVSVRINSTAPLFTDKNKSMQFYLRYNLWEDKKRKKGGLVAGR